MRILGHPVTALFVALALAGTASAGLLNNDLTLSLALWSLAALVAIVSLLEWRGWTLRSPLAPPPQPAKAPAPTAHRFPFQTKPGIASHILLTAGTPDTAVLSQGLLLPGPPKGDLPLRVEMPGLAGHRVGSERKDPWTWTAANVNLVNASDELLVMTVHLMTYRRTKGSQPVGIPGVVKIPARDATTETFSFNQPMAGPSWTDEDKASPPDAIASLDLLFLEVGTERELRIGFKTWPMRQASAAATPGGS